MLAEHKVKRPERAHQVAVRHDELGHHVHVVLPGGSQGGWGGLPRPESLPQLLPLTPSVHCPWRLSHLRCSTLAMTEIRLKGNGWGGSMQLEELCLHSVPEHCGVLYVHATAGVDASLGLCDMLGCHPYPTLDLLVMCCRILSSARQQC